MYVFIENCAHKSKNVYLNITILQKFCDKDFDIVNSWALTVQFQNVHSLLKLLKIHCSGHLNLCLEFLNDLKLQVNISSLTEMPLQTFDGQKDWSGVGRGLWSGGGWRGSG